MFSILLNEELNTLNRSAIFENIFRFNKIYMSLMLALELPGIPIFRGLKTRRDKPSAAKSSNFSMMQEFFKISFIAIYRLKEQSTFSKNFFFFFIIDNYK